VRAHWGASVRVYIYNVIVFFQHFLVEFRVGSVNIVTSELYKSLIYVTYYVTDVTIVCFARYLP